MQTDEFDSRHHETFLWGKQISLPKGAYVLQTQTRHNIKFSPLHAWGQNRHTSLSHSFTYQNKEVCN